MLTLEVRLDSGFLSCLLCCFAVPPVAIGIRMGDAIPGVGVSSEQFLVASISGLRGSNVWRGPVVMLNNSALDSI